MAGTRLFLIRIGVTSFMILAIFAIGWYLFTRFVELQGAQVTITSGQEEVNNPRINRSLLESLTEKFENRKLYSKDEQVFVTIEEEDPFYE